MISVPTARRLRDAGVTWTPDRGDRFIVADRDMDDEVFVLSDMTVDVHRRRDGTRLGFNGTTEWALDSVDDDDALWLPREGQLRGAARRDVRLPRAGRRRWRVTIAVTGTHSTHEHEDPEEAYALALLELVTASAA